MVENYKNKHFFALNFFIKNNIDSDFYITKNISRKLINDEKTLGLCGNTCSGSCFCCDLQRHPEGKERHD